MAKADGGGANADAMTAGAGGTGDARSRGMPVLLGDVATITIGGEMRRGVGELDGVGEALGA